MSGGCIGNEHAAGLAHLDEATRRELLRLRKLAAEVERWCDAGCDDRASGKLFQAFDAFEDRAYIDACAIEAQAKAARTEQALQTLRDVGAL